MMVALDIDGVLADFVPPFVRVLEKRAGNGAIDLQSITDPNFSNHPYLSKEIVSQCILEVSNDPAFWQQLAPLPPPEHWRALNTLSRQERLVFITHRYERETYDIGRVTCDWLKKHGITQPVVYFTQNHKSELIGELGVDLFVDDRHENCRDVAENTGAVVFMPHRTYNQSFSHPRVQRIQDLDELFAYLDK
jgi:FMN phosphatase YigB (HAD superfamily)